MLVSSNLCIDIIFTLGFRMGWYAFCVYIVHYLYRGFYFLFRCGNVHTQLNQRILANQLCPTNCYEIYYILSDIGSN